MDLKPLALAAATVLALAGCGNDGGDEPEAESSSSEATEAPAAATVSVALHDHGTLDALFNADGGTCTSLNLGEAFSLGLDNPDMSAEELRGLMPKTTVTLKNADGSTIGHQELPQDGGTFKKGTGCDWILDFPDIEPSDFYEVVVEHGDFSTTEQSEGGEGDAFLELTF
jgi:hypothetical protein